MVLVKVCGLYWVWCVSLRLSSGHSACKGVYSVYDVRYRICMIYMEMYGTYCFSKVLSGVLYIVSVGV